MKKAFITGITGQDGSYLAEFLLAKGYEIHGLIRRASTFNTDRIDHLYRDFHDPEARVYLHYGDLSVSGQLTDLLQEIKPDEIYHLGAQSHVRVSFDMLLFNHESPRRGETFVTRKITRAATRIKLGLQDKLYLGNMEAKRDWGFAGDYVEAMWLMLQQDRPDDYVIATGETHAVKEFVAKVFEKLGLDYERYVAVDPRYFRPTEVDALLGDAAKARQVLNWQPKVSFEQLIDMMIAADLEIAQKEKTLRDAGYAGGNHRMICLCHSRTPQTQNVRPPMRA